MDLRKSIATILIALMAVNVFGQYSPNDDWPTWRSRVIALVSVLNTNSVVQLDRLVRGFTKWCDFAPGHIRASDWNSMSTNTWATLTFTNPVITLTWEETEP